MPASRVLRAIAVSACTALSLVAAAPATPAMAGPSTPSAAASAVPTPRLPPDGKAAAPGEVVGGQRLGAPGLVVAPRPGVPAPPQVKAEAYVVADADTGEVLAAKGAHVRHRPASTLKTLTALTAAQQIPEDAVYTATRADTSVIGARAGLVEGSTYTMRDLMHGMFLKSGNDAATAVSNLAGGTRQFVASMNETARDLQAHDTVAVTPSGLDEPGQFTSAYDLALIGRAALRQPQLRRYASTKTYLFPNRNPPPGRQRTSAQIFTIQRFLLNYEGALGIKNGYTTLAGQTLIAASTRDGRTILVTLLKSGVGSWREAVSLSDWAYAHGSEVDEVGQLVEPLVPVQPEATLRAATPVSTAAAAGPASPVQALGLASLAGIGGAAGLVWWRRRMTPRHAPDGRPRRHRRETRTPVRLPRS